MDFLLILFVSLGLYVKFVHYNVRFMVVISSSELRSNMKKYLDIAAKNEKVLIQRGKNETFLLVAQQDSVEYDLSRSISVDEVISKVREGLEDMFERKKNFRKIEK